MKWPLRTKPGSFVTVHSVFGGYPLPEGIPENAVVCLIRWDHAYAMVEYERQRFRVFMGNLGKIQVKG
jgi:hypothetical protein